jgi:hypothetical protein
MMSSGYKTKRMHRKYYFAIAPALEPINAVSCFMLEIEQIDFQNPSRMRANTIPKAILSIKR